MDQPYQQPGLSVPRNLFAEAHLLGSIFLGPQETLSKLQNRVSEDDFYLPSHQIIFKALRDMHGTGQDITTSSVINQLETAEQLESAGNMDKIIDLSGLCETTAGLDDYIKAVKKTSLLRQLIHVSEEIIREVHTKKARPISELLGFAEEKIFALSKNQNEKGYKDIECVIQAVFDQIEKKMEFVREGDTSGVPTGYKDLDNLTTGWQQSDLIILAARPAMGKTAFSLNMAHYAAVKANMPTLFFSLEMSATQLGQRLLCIETKTPGDRLRHGNLSGEQFANLASEVGRLYEAPIFICDEPGINMLEIRSIARQVKLSHGLNLIVVDYIQLITSHNSGKNTSREQEISAISRQLKLLARELEVPVIALSQLSRQVESRTDKRPMLSDLRESGAIEQDADIVTFLYRDAYYKKGDSDSNKPDITEVIIAKHRAGPTGTIKLLWRNNIMRFENYVEDPFHGQQQ